MKKKLLLIATAAVDLLTPHAQAAVIYWDGGTTNIVTNGDGASQGGSGTWDGTIKNWDAGSGSAHTGWNKRYSAYFGGTAGTVTIGTSFTAAGITFATDGYILTGSNTITLKSGGITANGSATVNSLLKLFTTQSWTVASGKTLTIGGTVDTNGRFLTLTGAGDTAISGIVSGSGGLTKTGAGLLTLSGANTYTGITTLGGGTLNLGIAENAGTSGPLGKSTAAGSILFTGGTLQYSSLNATDYSGRFGTAGGQTWNIDTNGRSVTYATALVGSSSSLIKRGSGTLTLSGANTYTSGTTISAGILNVTGTLADTGVVTVSGGTYTAGANDTIGALTLSSGTIDGAGTLTASSYAVQSGTIGNILAGTGALAKTTASTVTLSGASTYTGGTTISAGILNVTGTLANSGAVTVSGGTYTVGANDTIGALTLSSGTIDGTATLTGASYAVQSGTISAILGGTGALTKSTIGTVTLSGNNSYNGATTISSGVLVVNGALSAASAVSLAGGSTLSGIGSVGGTVTVANDPTATIIAGNGTSGALTIGNLGFLGAGTIQIGTLSNYTGSAALNVTGNLTLAGSAGAVSLALPAGTVSEGTYHLISNSLTNLTGFSITGATLGARQTYQLVNTAGKIDYVVSGANPYWTGALGTEWSTATLASPKNWALSPSQTTDFINNDAVLFDDRATATTVSIASTVSPNVVSFANSTKNYILQGAAGIATGALTKSGTGSLTITNANTYGGGTTLYSGILKVGNNSAFGSGPVTLDSGVLSSDSATARTLANPLFIAGNMTLGDPVSTGELTFSGAVNLDGATRQLTTASDITMSGVISNGGLVKTGTGILTLSGSNIYTGGTVLSAGTLAVNSATSLGDSAGLLTFAGNSSLLFRSAYSSSRGYSINTGVTATIDTNGLDITQTGILSGSGGLAKTGAGTFTVSGINTYTGETTISAGTLALSGGAAIGDAGTVTLANVSGATLLLNASETIGSLAGGGTTGGSVNLLANTLTVGNAADSIYAGVITGTGALVKSGTGSLTLSGSNTYSGVTTINSGNLKVSSDSALGAVPGSATAGKLVLAGGTLATTATFTLNSNRGITTGGSIDVAAGTTLTYGGIAAGAGALTKTGTGTLVLSGVNTYTGATTASAGNLAINGTLNSASAVSVSSDAILSGTGTISGSVTAADGAILMAGNGVSGALSITGALTFAADGQIQIGTLSNYTGSAALKVNGSLTLQDSAASIILNLPTGAVSNGTYHLVSHGNNINTNDFQLFSVAGPTAGVRQAAVLTNNNGSIDYVVSGDTPFWTGAAGSAWNLSASNWKLVIAGTTTQFLANDAVLFNDNATGSTTVDIAANVNPAVVSFANSAKNYLLQGAAGITTGSLAKSGTGTLTITNANTYNDGTTLTAGVLQVGNNSALGTGVVSLNGGTLSSDSTTARTLANSIIVGGDVTLGSATQSGTLTLSGTLDLGDSTRLVTAPSNVIVTGIISNGSLTKSGPGTMTLSGANSYTGATQVTGGKLIVNGSLANASMTVGTGATLGGSGTIAGSTVIQSGGVHAPGNSAGLQNLANLTYSDGSIFSWEIDRTLTQTRGTGYDAVNVSGTLAGLDGADLNTTTDAVFRIVIGDSDFSNSFWNTPRSWSDVFTGADGITAKANWTSIFGGGFEFYNTSGNAIAAPVSGSFSFTGNTLSWSAVPEPTSALAGLLLGAGLLRRRRR